MQLSVAVRNARLAAIKATVGTAPLLQMFTGTKPANCAAVDSGTKLAEMTLPSDWLSAPSGGTAGKVGTWATTGITGGSAGHYRLKDSTGTTCGAQGSITTTGGGGELILDNVVIATSQAVSVSTWVLTDGNA